MKNQQQMMKQLQQVQARMAKMQEELNDVTVTGTAGGGVVSITADGHQKVLVGRDRARGARGGRRAARRPDPRGDAMTLSTSRARPLPRTCRSSPPAWVFLPVCSDREPRLMRRRDVPLVPEAVERLAAEFGRLPGIGPKTAQRLTFYCLRASAGHVPAPRRRAERPAHPRPSVLAMLLHRRRAALRDMHGCKA